MLNGIKESIIRGKRKQIGGLVQEALDAGNTPREILDIMTCAMDEVGDKFQRNELFVPEILVAAKTMQIGVNVLKPVLGGDCVGKLGKCIIGTVAGDLHDIGKNLVAMMIEAAGFEVIDLGVDVPAGKFVETVRENPDCKIIGFSALLTTTMESMENAVKALADAGLKDQVKIMVGGAPITAAFAEQIGADVYTADAGAAAARAKELVG